MARPTKPITSVSIPEEKRNKHNALLRERLERLGVTPSDQIRRLFQEIELVDDVEKRLKWRLQSLTTVLPFLLPKIRDADLNVLMAQSVTQTQVMMGDMSPEQLAAAEALAEAMNGPKSAEIIDVESDTKENSGTDDK